MGSSKGDADLAKTFCSAAISAQESPLFLIIVQLYTGSEVRTCLSSFSPVTISFNFRDEQILTKNIPCINAFFFFQFWPIIPILDICRRSSSSSCLNIFSLIVIVKCSLKSNISISNRFPLPQFLLTEPRSIQKRKEKI